MYFGKRMISGTIRVFHESKNATVALRGCTHFENIRRRESHFSIKKTPSKNRHFHHDKRCILENECSVAPYGVPRVQKRYSFLTRLHPLREHSPMGITLFPKSTLKKTDISTMINGVFWRMNAQWHHYCVPGVQNR